MPAPTYQTFAEGRRTLGSSVTVAKPTGTVEGDLLVALVCHTGNPNISAPGGWTQINQGNTPAFQARVGVWWKKAGSSEPANYTFTWSGPKDAYAFIVRITGQHSTTPIDADDFDTGTSNAPTCPDVTTTVADTLVLRLFGVNNDNVTIDGGYPSSHTGITVDISRVDAEACAGGGAYKTQAGAGATGAAAFSILASEAWRATTVAIAPAEAAGGLENKSAGMGAKMIASKLI